MNLEDVTREILAELRGLTALNNRESYIATAFPETQMEVPCVTLNCIGSYQEEVGVGEDHSTGNKGVRYRMLFQIDIFDNSNIDVDEVTDLISDEMNESRSEFFTDAEMEDCILRGATPCTYMGNVEGGLDAWRRSLTYEVHTYKTR